MLRCNVSGPTRPSEHRVGQADARFHMAAVSIEGDEAVAPCNLFGACCIYTFASSARPAKPPIRRRTWEST